MSSDCNDENAVCLYKKINVHGSTEYRSLCYCNDSYKRDSTGKCKAGKVQNEVKLKCLHIGTLVVAVRLDKK